MNVTKNVCKKCFLFSFNYAVDVVQQKIGFPSDVVGDVKNIHEKSLIIILSNPQPKYKVYFLLRLTSSTFISIKYIHIFLEENETRAGWLFMNKKSIFF